MVISTFSIKLSPVVRGSKSLVLSFRILDHQKRRVKRANVDRASKNWNELSDSVVRIIKKLKKASKTGSTNFYRA